MLRKTIALIVLWMFFIVGVALAEDGNPEKTYTLDQTLEKISMYKSYLGLEVKDEKIYDVVIKHFPAPDSTISEQKYQKIVDEIKKLDEDISKNVHITGLIMILITTVLGATFMILHDR